MSIHELPPRSATDIGPAPGPSVARVERRAKRLHDMIARLDIDAVRLARLDRGEVYAEARKRCLICASASDCLGWLDHSAAEAGASPPHFCPNSPAFARVASMGKKPLG